MTTPSTTAVTWVESRLQHGRPALLCVRPGEHADGRSRPGWPVSGDIQVSANGGISGGASQAEQVYALNCTSAWAGKLCGTTRDLSGMMADMWREVVRYSTQRCLEDNTTYYVVPGYTRHVYKTQPGGIDIGLGFSLCDASTAQRLTIDAPPGAYVPLQTIPFQPTLARVTEPVDLDLSSGGTRHADLSRDVTRLIIDPDWRPAPVAITMTQCDA